MNTVGIFEAKTKFTSLCEQVAKTGDSIVVSKRGHPMVVLSPVPRNLQSKRPDILKAWLAWKEKNGTEDAEFPEVWKLRGKRKSNPLAQ
jgi:prevent-host-death family protein